MTTPQNDHVTSRRRRAGAAHPCRTCRQRTPALLALLALACQGLFVTSSQARGSLRETLRTEDADWIVGDWQGTNDQGQPITVEYEWELEGYMLEIHLTMGDTTYKGTIVRRADDGRIVEIGGDNGGGTTDSTWEVKDGALITRRTGTGPDGQVIRIAVKNQKVDVDTVLATVHTLSPDGALGEVALDTVRLTRSSQQEDED